MRDPRRWPATLENALDAVPLLIGIVATLYVEVVERYVSPFGLQFNSHHESALTLVLVSLIAVSIGVQHMKKFRRIDAQFERLRSTINATVSSQKFVSTQTELYDEAARLACTALHSIRVLSQGAMPPAPPDYVNRLVSYLKEHRDVVLTVVIRVDLAEVDESFWHAQQDRFESFVRQGIAGQVVRLVLNRRSSADFDVLLVDANHVGLGFTPVPQPVDGRNKEVSIFFEQQPRIAGSFQQWFESAVLLQSMPFEEARSAWIETRNNKRSQSEVERA